MTVADLKEILAKLDDRIWLEVVIAKDAEGNHYSPLSQVTYGRYLPRTAWAGEIEFSALNDATVICLWHRG